jgi:hypothetical protein
MKKVSEMTRHEALDAASGYIESAIKSIIRGRFPSAYQTLSRAQSYIRRAKTR